jgi:hypothetical protein
MMQAEPAHWCTLDCMGRIHQAADALPVASRQLHAAQLQLHARTLLCGGACSMHLMSLNRDSNMEQVFIAKIGHALLAR